MACPQPTEGSLLPVDPNGMVGGVGSTAPCSRSKRRGPRSRELCAADPGRKTAAFCVPRNLRPFPYLPRFTQQVTT